MDPMLIIGNGGAAMHAIMALRSAGYTGTIKQVSDKPENAFNPMLAPYYLKGAISWSHCFPFGKDFYEKHEVDCRFGAAVTEINTTAQKVLLEDGRRLSYNKCLIATGARPIIPPVPGLEDATRALPLRTPQCTQKIEKACESANRIVVLGASLVGVKLAEIFKKKEKEVLLLDVAPQMMPIGAHPHTAALLEDYFVKNGIEVRLGCTLEGLEGAPRGVTCHFPDSVVEEADFVAVCTGIKPNLDFVDTDEIKVDRAIVVDETMRTSAGNVYAAGDVCQGLNRLTGESEWLGTWGNACYQGRIAGFNMAGVYRRHAGAIPQHVSPFFDWSYIQIGDANRSGLDVRTQMDGDPFAGKFRLLVYENDALVGANLINCSEGIGPLKKAITQRTICEGLQ